MATEISTDIVLVFALRGDGWKLLCAEPKCCLPHHWSLRSETLEGTWTAAIYPQVIPATTELPIDLIERFVPRRPSRVRGRSIELSYSTCLARKLGETRNQHELDTLRTAVEGCATLIWQEFGPHPNQEYSFSAVIYHPATPRREELNFGCILRTDDMCEVFVALAVTLDELLAISWLPQGCEPAPFLPENETGLPN